MSVEPQTLKEMVERELALLTDSRVTEFVKSLLVEPTITVRGWDYGCESESYPCWSVLNHPASNTGIAYCEHGFGPRSPWGLVFLECDNARISIGMDSAWFTTFLQAFFESGAATTLPIWRVFKTDAATMEQRAISDEGEWDATWAKVMALRETDPTNQYHCWTSINYDRE
jgi:hypothetical protein